jgi:hypothetical protein
MRIRFERTGGIANIPLRAEFDSAEMPAERSETLKGLVERVRPFDQPAEAHGPVAMADQFQLVYSTATVAASRSGNSAACARMK